jgi:predicted GIY-YIG superfamily endonuclease
MATSRFNENLQPALQTDTAKNIIREFEKWALKNSTGWIVYSNWYVGITNNPNARKSAHNSANGHLYFWLEQNARSRRIAEAIETYFHNKGMKEKDLKGGAKDDSKYIYIYKKYPTIVD